MGAVSYTSGSGSFTVPSTVQRVWVSCIGGGGGASAPRFISIGGSVDIDSSSTRPNGGGGGGLGTGAVNVSSTSINYTVGAGGAASGWSGNTGIAGSAGGTSACLGISGFGGALGLINGSGGAGGGFSAPAGANGSAGTRQAGGAAGGRSGGGSSAGCNNAWAGGGGNGSVGNGGSGNVGSCSTAQGGNGGAGGGGAGGIYYNASVLGTSGSFFSGTGGAGEVYVSWIDLTAGKTTLRANESTTVSWNSPVDSGSTTVSWDNTGTSNITQTFTRIDSRGARSTITFTILPRARITSFSASPNPQTSGSDGIPNYDTQLSWSTAGATSASITNVGNVSFNGTTTVTNLPQSTAGSNSPATRSYTLNISDGFNSDSRTITVSVFNDNTPRDFSVPNQNNVEPNTLIVISVGQILDIDMITAAVGGPGVQVSTNGSSWSGTVFVSNGNNLLVRVTSLPFNTNPNGLTNSASYYVDVGTIRRFFTVTTRAPIVNEIFNYPNYNDRVPFPDIDTINEPSLPFIETAATTMDDIELTDPFGVEIKTNNPNVQMRKRIAGSSGDFTPWQDVRST